MNATRSARLLAALGLFLLMAGPVGLTMADGRFLSNVRREPVRPFMCLDEWFMASPAERFMLPAIPHAGPFAVIGAFVLIAGAATVIGRSLTNRRPNP